MSNGHLESNVYFPVEQGISYLLEASHKTS